MFHHIQITLTLILCLKPLSLCKFKDWVVHALHIDLFSNIERFRSKNGDFTPINTDVMSQIHYQVILLTKIQRLCHQSRIIHKYL